MLISATWGLGSSIAQGAVVPDVAVTIKSVDRNVSFPTRTNSAGYYRAVNLVPGKYLAHFEKSGFLFVADFFPFLFLFPTGAPRIFGSKPHISRRKLDSLFPEAMIIVLTVDFSSGKTTISTTNQPFCNFRIGAFQFFNLTKLETPLHKSILRSLNCVGQFQSDEV